MVVAMRFRKCYFINNKKTRKSQRVNNEHISNAKGPTNTLRLFYTVNK